MMMSDVLDCGSVAQLVEQRTFNPLVVGSNPARPTTSDFKLSPNITTRDTFAVVQQ